jgi:hypothetical protein
MADHRFQSSRSDVAQHVDLQDVEPLLDLLDDPDEQVRTAAVRALVRLPLTNAAWASAAMVVMRRLRGEASPVSRHELIANAVFLPFKSVRDELISLLQASSSDTRQAAALALALARDPRALKPLLEQLRTEEHQSRLAAAEALSRLDTLQLLGAVASLKQILRTEAAVDVRFWLALAMARSGRFLLLAELLDDPPSGLFDKLPDMFELEGRIRDSGPPAAGVLEELGELDDVRGPGWGAGLADAILAGWEAAAHQAAATGQESMPPFELRSDPESVAEARRLAATLGTSAAEVVLSGTVPLEQVESLANLPRTELGTLVSEVFAQLPDLPDDFLRDDLRVDIGNVMVMVISRLPYRFRPDVTSLLETYQRLVERAARWDTIAQLAWTAAQGGARWLLAGLAPKLAAGDTHSRALACRLLERAAPYFVSDERPAWGGGARPSPPVPPPLIDEVAVSHPAEERERDTPAGIGERAIEAWEEGFLAGDARTSPPTFGGGSPEPAALPIPAPLDAPEVFDHPWWGDYPPDDLAMFIRPPEAEIRRLQAEVAEKASGRRRTYTFAPGTEHVVRMHIGPASAGSLALEIGIPEHEVRHDRPEGALLHLEFVSEGPTGIDRQQQMLLLPHTGPTAQAPFGLSVAPDADSARCSILVFQGARLLQSAELSGPVATQDSPVGGRRLGLVWTADVVAAPTDEHRPHFDASLSFHVGAAEDALLVDAEQNSRVLRVQGLDELHKRIVDLLRNAVEDDALDGPEPGSPQQEELLRGLARQGNTFHQRLRPDLGKTAIRSTIQLTTLEDSVIPLEFVYDFGYPTANARLSRHWREALASGRCRCRPRDGTTRVICPLGFWGVRLTIERQLASGGGRSMEASIFGQPRPGHDTLAALNRVLFAASARVDGVNKGERKRTTDLLRQRLGDGCKVATSWREWKRGRRPSPRLAAVPAAQRPSRGWTTRARDRPAKQAGGGCRHRRLRPARWQRRRPSGHATWL